VFFNVRAQSIHSGLPAFAGGLECFKKGRVKRRTVCNTAKDTTAQQPSATNQFKPVPAAN
jgi:hypothetical protein